MATNRGWAWESPRWQTVVNALLFPGGDSPGPVTEIAPWFDSRFHPVDEIVARLDQQTHRRSVKTHTAADGIPWYPTASYIVVGRDGRDAFVSFVNHMANLKTDTMHELVSSAIADGIDLRAGGPPPVDDVHGFFSWWLDLHPMWFRHVASFWAHRGELNVLFVHYDDMKADLDLEMQRVREFLGIEIDAQRWPDLVEQCAFAR